MSDLKQLCSVGAGVGRATITLTLEPVTCRARRSPPSHLARLQPRAIIGRLVATCLRLADQETTSTSRMDRKYRR